MQSQSDIDFDGQNFQVEASSMASIKAPNVAITGQVALGGPGGQPLLMLSAMMIGTGNLGLPVISQAISGYTTMVTGQ
jgi:hypothetical protein